MKAVSLSEQDLQELELALKRDAEPGAPPPGLHKVIMDSVRAQREGARERNDAPPADRSGAVDEQGSGRFFWDQLLRWLPAPALGLCVLLAFVIARPSAPTEKSPAQLATAASILLSGTDITDSATGSLLAPMEEEYKRLSEDISRTAAFLVSCVP